MALQLLSPVLRARAVPSVLSSGKTHWAKGKQATGGLFFIERATVCLAAGATTRTDKEQPASAIIATLASVYVQPPCNSTPSPKCTPLVRDCYRRHRLKASSCTEKHLFWLCRR
ncbi:hypothetical protein DVB73_14040 [Pseudomonas plecoglossicida]|uniref:Uncharacterized protein n=1 Tax=Pseudomonas plecoglossicida TaxID=70775 RepID=A0AAD0QXM0_PSEDL|nr:hypothetical protein DVB73_14040 [Pseudomonas plecoglossicida]